MRLVRRSQRSRAGALLPVGVMLLAVLAAACGSGGQNPPATDIATRAASSTKAEKSFHFVFDEKNGPTSTSGMHLVFAEGDIVVPDKVKADVSGTFQGVPLRSQLVVVGGKYFLKNPFTGKWSRVSASMNPVAFFDPAKGVLEVIKSAKQLEVVGSEKVGTTDAYHLKGKTTLTAIAPLLGNPPGTRLVDVELWVDKKTNRLVRVRLSGQVEKGDPAGAVRTIEISRYGVVVPITAPQT